MLQHAAHGVQQLDQQYIKELLALMRPKPEVAKLMDYIMLMLDRPTGWPSVRKEVSQPDFIRRICSLKPKDVPASVVKKHSDMTIYPETLMAQSTAAAVLGVWVKAINDQVKRDTPAEDWEELPAPATSVPETKATEVDAMQAAVDEVQKLD